MQQVGSIDTSRRLALFFVNQRDAQFASGWNKVAALWRLHESSMQRHNEEHLGSTLASTTEVASAQNPSKEGRKGRSGANCGRRDPGWDKWAEARHGLGGRPSTFFSFQVTTAMAQDVLQVPLAAQVFLHA